MVSSHSPVRLEEMTAAFQKALTAEGFQVRFTMKLQTLHVFVEYVSIQPSERDRVIRFVGQYLRSIDPPADLHQVVIFGWQKGQYQQDWQESFQLASLQARLQGILPSRTTLPATAVATTNGASPHPNGHVSLSGRSPITGGFPGGMALRIPPSLRTYQPEDEDEETATPAAAVELEPESSPVEPEQEVDPVPSPPPASPPPTIAPVPPVPPLVLDQLKTLPPTWDPSPIQGTPLLLMLVSVLGSFGLGLLGGLAFQQWQDTRIAQQLYEQAEQLTTQGEWQQAIQTYQAALIHRPHYPTAQLALQKAEQAQQALLDRIQQARAQIAAQPQNGQARLQLAEGLTQLGDLEQAQQELSTVIWLDPENVSAYLQKGQILIQQQQWDPAIRHLQAALKWDPDNPQAQAALQYIQATQAQLTPLPLTDPTLQPLQAALAKNPQDPQTHFALARQLLQMGRVDAAIGYLQATLRLDPDYPQAQAYMQIATQQQQALRQALSQLTASPPPATRLPQNPSTAQLTNPTPKTPLPPPKTPPPTPAVLQAAASGEISPSRSPLPWLLGLGSLGLGIPLLFLLGKHRSSLRLPRPRPISPSGGNNRVLRHYQQALEALQQQQETQALTELETVLKLNPRFAPAYQLLGSLAAQKSDWPTALNNYRQAEAVSPDLPELAQQIDRTLIAYGKTLLSQKAFDQALEHLRMVIPSKTLTKSEKAPIHTLIGHILLKQNLWIDARNEFQQALIEDAKQPEAFVGMGHVLRCQGERELSIDMFETALGLDKNLAAAHHGKGLSLLILGQLSAALEAYQTAIDLAASPPPDFYVDLGLALLQAGDLHRAKEYFQQAIDHDPQAARAHCAMGQLLWMQEEVEEAIEKLEWSLQLDPELWLATAIIGLTHLSRKRHSISGKKFVLPQDADLAASQFERVIANDPSVAEAHFGMGELFRIRGNLLFSVQHYRSAINANGSYTAAYFRLGSIYAKLGQLDKAAQELRQALLLNPHHTEAKTTLNRVLARRVDDSFTEIMNPP